MGRTPKNRKLETNEETKKPNGLEQEKETVLEPEKDERPDFVPRETQGNRQSVTIPLKDGKLDIDSLSEKRTDSLKTILSTPEARRKLGLIQSQGEPGGITIKAMGPLFGVLGFAEGMAVSISAKIPRDVAISIMMVNDQEFAKVAPLAARILERSAPAWLRNLLLSENAEIGEFLIAMFHIHQGKLEQIKQWKIANQGGQHPEPTTPAPVQ